MVSLLHSPRKNSVLVHIIRLLAPDFYIFFRSPNSAGHFLRLPLLLPSFPFLPLPPSISSRPFPSSFLHIFPPSPKNPPKFSPSPTSSLLASPITHSSTSFFIHFTHHQFFSQQF